MTVPEAELNARLDTVKAAVEHLLEGAGPEVTCAALRLMADGFERRARFCRQWSDEIYASVAEANERAMVLIRKEFPLP